MTKVIDDYDKDNDIYSISWGEAKHSRELYNGKVIIDFNKEDRIVGIEMFDFDKELDKSDEEIKRLFGLEDEE